MKSMTKLFLMVAVFGVVAFSLLFTALYTWEVGKEGILEPVYNSSVIVGNQEGISAQMLASIDADKTSYENLEIPYDLYFIWLLLGALITTFTTAYLSSKESTISFYGYLTFGMMIFLGLVSIIDFLLGWLVDNLIYGLFSDAIFSAPLMFSFINNLGMWCFIWALGLLLVNQLDIKKTPEELQ